VKEQQWEYWQEDFSDDIPVLELPVDFPRPALQSFAGNVVKFKMDSRYGRDLKAYALEKEVTLYMLLLALYNVLLSRLSGEEEIVIGTPVAGRRHSDLSGIIGVFINTLAMRNFPGAEKTFDRFLQEVKQRTLQVFENQDYPFEDLVDRLDVNRDTGRNPLFDVMLVLQNIEMQQLQMPGLELAGYPFENRTSKFDMTLTAAGQDLDLDFTITYNTDLFKRTTIERFAGYFQRIAAGVLEDPGKKIAEIDILSPEEKQQLLVDFNETAGEYPGEKTVYQLFQEQAVGTPDCIAVMGNGLSCLTYGELNRRANCLARLLRKKGIDADAVVGIMAGPSLEMVVGIMAILKAGGAYLPIDPRHPDERIRYMLKDSRAKLLLTQTVLLSDKVIGGIEITVIGNHDVYKGEGADLEPAAGPLNLLYTVYTSGSTGKPKGVLLKHGNLVNYVSWFVNRVGLTRRDRTVLTSSFGFDLGYTSIYSAILKGCQLHVPEEGVYLSPERLIDYIIDHGISYVKMTPSLFNTLVESWRFSAALTRVLRLVVLGGEAIKAADVVKAYEICGSITIMNHYGPTESTIGSVAQFIPGEQLDEYSRRPTIGQPIFNTRVYILDHYLKLLPAGAAGKLCIAGSGLARGYLNRPELTAEKFCPVSYIPGKIYKTGDLARRLVDGNIEFLGRIDNQVKIRGYRIELGEGGWENAGICIYVPMWFRINRLIPLG
jgi:amino acid adenylation domain-containing protein